MKKNIKALHQLYRAAYTAAIFDSHPELFNQKEYRMFKPTLRKSQWPLAFDILSNRPLVKVINEWFGANIVALVRDRIDNSNDFLSLEAELLCPALAGETGPQEKEAIKKWLLETFIRRLSPDIEEQKDIWLKFKPPTE